MIEIKFDAVDEDTGDYVIYNDWLLENGKENYSDNEHLALFLEFHHDYLLLPYIGITDINGEEIYKGSIVKIHSHIAKTNTIGKVDYNDKVSAYMVLDSKFNQLIPITKFDEIELMGNEYQNKELLNV